GRPRLGKDIPCRAEVFLFQIRHAKMAGDGRHEEPYLMFFRQCETLFENDCGRCRIASAEHQAPTAISRRDAIEGPTGFIGYRLGSSLELVGRIEFAERRMGE